MNERYRPVYRCQGCDQLFEDRIDVDSRTTAEHIGRLIFMRTSLQDADGISLKGYKIRRVEEHRNCPAMNGFIAYGAFVGMRKIK